MIIGIDFDGTVVTHEFPKIGKSIGAEPVLRRLVDSGQKSWTDSPKAYCHMYIDDAALGCPLVHPQYGRPFVWWKAVEQYLVESKIIER